MLDSLSKLVGAANVITDPAALQPYLHEQRGQFESRCLAVVRPANTQQVSSVLAFCNQQRIPVVPQGGNTGLCGGAVASENAIILSLSRLDTIRHIDPTNYSITAEAGVILQTLQETAASHQRLFPLSLGAEGSCQIGGNLSTNAGGINVLRYGNARDLTLGLEVVLANGDVWDGLTSLRKDNTGYDLKQLFIGSEGTLGIITAASLKLFPQPAEAVTALVAVPDLDAVIELFSELRQASSDRISTFELIPHIAIEFCTRHFPDISAPFESLHPWYVLVVLHSNVTDPNLQNALESGLAKQFEQQRVNDAIVASSDTQAAQLLSLREKLVEAQKFEGGSIKHDVSIPISKIPDFIQRASNVVEQTIPGARPYPFGHIGDGNIHYNVSQPLGMNTVEYLSLWNRLNHAIHDLVASLNGSFSAEHGVGLLKTSEMTEYKSPVALDLMQHLKNSLDPNGILNPGKVVPQS